jgi:hypothetical protein
MDDVRRADGFGRGWNPTGLDSTHLGRAFLRLGVESLKVALEDATRVSVSQCHPVRWQSRGRSDQPERRWEEVHSCSLEPVFARGRAGTFAVELQRVSLLVVETRAVSWPHLVVVVHPEQHRLSVTRPM